MKFLMNYQADQSFRSESQGYQCSLTKLFLKKRPHALPTTETLVAASSYLAKIKSLRLEGPRGIYANYSNHLPPKEDSQDSNEEDLEEDEESFFEDVSEETSIMNQAAQSTGHRDHDVNCSCSDCSKTFMTELSKTEFKVNAEVNKIGDSVLCIPLIISTFRSKISFREVLLTRKQ